MRILAAIFILFWFCVSAIAQFPLNLNLFSGPSPESAAGGGSSPYPALVYYKMDESGTADRVDHYVGNDLSGSFKPNAGTGKINNGCDFVPASFNFLTVSDVNGPDLSLGSNVDYSWSFWCKFDDTGVLRCVFSKDSGTTEYTCFRNTDDKLYWRWWNGAGDLQDATTTATLSSATWYHVVITYDQSNVRFYINGTLDSTTANSNDARDSTSDFTIGRDESAGAWYFDGIIDEVGLWKSALTQANVTYLYNGGSGIQP